MTLYYSLQFAALQILWAVMQTYVHSDIIRKGLMTREYKRAWSYTRAFMVSAVAAVLFMAVPAAWISILAASAGSNFLFRPAFNVWLAKRMGWNPLYLGSTSDNDVLILCIWLHRTSAEVRFTHQPLYQNNKEYQRNVHRAALFTYVIDLTLALLAFWLSTRFFLTTIT